MKNEKRYISSVTLLVIAIFLAINIHDSEAKKLTVPEIREFLRPKSDACVSKTGVSQDMVDRARQNGEFPEDPVLQDYYGCYFQSMRVIGKNGKIDVDVMHKQMLFITKDDVVGSINDILTECLAKTTSDDTGVAAWEFVKCYHEISAELYFLP